jgi:hypothetical protein
MTSGRVVLADRPDLDLLRQHAPGRPAAFSHRRADGSARVGEREPRGGELRAGTSGRTHETADAGASARSAGLVAPALTRTDEPWAANSLGWSAAVINAGLGAMPWSFARPSLFEQTPARQDAPSSTASPVSCSQAA